MGGVYQMWHRGMGLGWGAFALLGLSACAQLELGNHLMKAPVPASRPQQQAAVRAPQEPNPTSPNPIYKVGTPYVVNGVTYVPKEDPIYNTTGIASWYGYPFHGQRTANGDIYDMNAMTAAHQTLPMPSYVRVTNLENGRSVVLQVNDRGPFVNGRIIDVSRRAADLLGFSEKGTTLVKVEAVQGPTENLIATRGAVADAPLVTVAAAPRPVVAVEALAPAAGVALAPPPPNNTPRFKTTVPPEVTFVGVPATNRIFVQAGAFASYESANTLRSNLSALGPTAVTTVDVNGRPLYRVRLGPLENTARAETTLGMVIARGHTEARIVVD